MANIAKINVGGMDYNVKDILAQTHLEDFSNPHEVTKEQIGLSNVENLTPEQLLKENLDANLISNALGYTPASSANADNKIDRFVDSEASAVVNFINGIRVNGANIYYNSTTNTVTFS